MEKSLYLVPPTKNVTVATEPTIENCKWILSVCLNGKILAQSDEIEFLLKHWDHMKESVTFFCVDRLYEPWGTEVDENVVKKYCLSFLSHDEAKQIILLSDVDAE